MLRSFTLASLFVFSAFASAQPVLTFASNAPVPGTSYTLHYGPYVSPGNAGADQTWDLSALATDSTNLIQLVAPATTEHGASFPGATVAETGAAASMYFRSASDGMYFVGSDAEDLVIFNSDEGKYLPFPCSYGSNWADDVAAQFSTEGMDVSRSGTISGTVDGYGTVIMPSGTVQDVLRVHWLQYTTDETEFFSFESVYDSYLFYAVGHSYPMAQLVTTSITFMDQTTTSQYAQWVDELSTGGEDEVFALKNMEIFPVPTTGTLNVNFPEHFSGAPLLMITDAEGRTVRGSRSATVSGRSGRLDVSDLVSGIYQLTAIDELGQRATRRFIVQ